MDLCAIPVNGSVPYAACNQRGPPVPTKRRMLAPVYTGQREGVVMTALSNTGAQQFQAPGPNSDGDPDWVLILETSPSQAG